MSTYLEAIASAAVERHGAIQQADELAAFLDAMSRHLAATVPAERDPVIVEIGCDAGGGLFALRSLSSCVIGVELAGINGGTGRPLIGHGATVVIGNSHDRSTFYDLLRVLPEEAEVDLLVIDADHSYEGVAQDWDMYAGLVRAGGVVAFHDTVDNPASPFGVPKFWRELVDGDNRRVVSSAEVSLHSDWGGIGWVVLA